MTSITKAWSLLVVSSTGQEETIPHQRAWAQSVAAEKGWTLEREFAGSGTGKDGPRKKVRELLDALRAAPSKPEWLLMIRTDRLGRGKIADQLPVRDELREMGVRIWTRDKGDVSIDSDEDELIAGFDAYVALKENRVRRDKSRAFHQRFRDAGRPGTRAPYGLAFAPNGYAVVPDQAEAVRQAFAWRLEGLGVWKIAQQLAAIAPPARYQRSGEQAVHWTSGRVAYLLSRPAYCGTIVDELTFRRVQALAGTARYRRPVKHPWPLAGALRCYCGRSMIGTVTVRDRGKRVYRYYRCDATWAHGGHNRVLAARPLEEAFGALLARMTTTEGAQDAYRRAQSDLPSGALLARARTAAQQELALIERARGAAWSLHDAGKLSDDHLQPRLEQLAAQKADVEARLAEIAHQVALVAVAEASERDALALLGQAVVAWADERDLERRQRTARTVSRAFGLCCEPDGSLTLRRAFPADTRRQERA